MYVVGTARVRAHQGETVTEWLVRLAGHDFDLADLAGWFSESECGIERGQDGYYLKSSAFASMSDAGDVLAKAAEIVQRVNGLGRVQNPSFQPVTLGHVFRIHDDGRRTGFVFGSGSISARGRLTGVGEVIGADGRVSSTEVERRSSNPEKQLVLASQRPEIAQVLRLFGEPEGRTALGLYKIWEIIAADVPKTNRNRDKVWEKAVIGRGRATGQELESLRSLHDPSVLGDSARHAVQSRPSPAVRWTLSDAEHFIRGLITNWLR